MSGKKFTTKQTLQDAVVATGPGAALDVTGLSRIGFYVTMAGTGLVGFEATIDGQEWHGLKATCTDNTVPASTVADAAGLYLASVAGLAQVRAKVLAVAGGALSVAAVATSAGI
jgi:hypothetical protein